MAAQGLAIALAEDTLALKASAPPAGSAEELKVRMRLAGQALGILGRINDSVPDGSVNVNMGHCYFVRGEEEKAIQAVSSYISQSGEEDIKLIKHSTRPPNFGSKARMYPICCTCPELGTPPPTEIPTIPPWARRYLLLKRYTLCFTSVLGLC